MAASVEFTSTSGVRMPTSHTWPSPTSRAEPAFRSSTFRSYSAAGSGQTSHQLVPLPGILSLLSIE